MNNNFNTTGLKPLAVGSVEIFELQATLYMLLPWDLTGGTVILQLLSPPNPTIPNDPGTTYSVTATIVGGIAKAQWTIIGPVGTWRRTWVITDAAGVHQVSNPIPFAVINSPGP